MSKQEAIRIGSGRAGKVPAAASMNINVVDTMHHQLCHGRSWANAFVRACMDGGEESCNRVKFQELMEFSQETFKKKSALLHRRPGSSVVGLNCWA